VDESEATDHPVTGWLKILSGISDAGGTRSDAPEELAALFEGGVVEAGSTSKNAADAPSE
jgi:hypothetical protein